MRARRWTILLTLAGCASAQSFERAAERHEAAARKLEAEGRYEDGLREYEIAADEREKAEQRVPHQTDVLPPLDFYK